MLKLCGAEGSSFRFEGCLSSVLLKQRLGFVEVHQIGPFVMLLSDLFVAGVASCSGDNSHGFDLWMLSVHCC